LSIYIYNNAIGNISSSRANSYASVFEVANAGNVKIYHNTVMLDARTTSQIHTQIFYTLTNTSSIASLNNLFVNTIPNVGENLFSQFILMPSGASLFNISNYNVYNGTTATVCRYIGNNN
jgi:hypothetical protein